MNLVVKQGNPVLYGYICQNMYDCHITSKEFNNISKYFLLIFYLFLLNFRTKFINYY